MKADTCDQCGKRTPIDRLIVEKVCGASMDSPAEYETRCDRPTCKVCQSRQLSRMDRLQAAADAGFDTWADYRGER